MKKVYVSAVLYVAVAILAACTALGVANPQTFNQKLAYAYGNVTAVRSITLSELQDGMITAKEAQNIQNGADDAKSALDTARLASSNGDLTTAEGKLKTAQTILTALQTFLNSKKGTQ